MPHGQPTARRGRVSALVIALALAVPMITSALALAPAPADAQAAQAGEITSAGTEFWFAFPEQLGEGGDPDIYTSLDPEDLFEFFRLFIAAETAATGTVSVPGTAIPDTSFTVTAGGLTQIDLPTDVKVTTLDGIEDLGILVTADEPVTVYALSLEKFSSDAFLVFPTAALGTEYYAVSVPVISFGSDVRTGGVITVVATEDDTRVTVTPAIDAQGRVAGEPYDVTLDRGQVYQLQSERTVTGADMTGTRVVSDRPVAFISSVQAASIPLNVFPLDTVIQQLPATSNWSTVFGVPDLEPRERYTLRVLAARDETEVRINGALVATLDAGEFHSSIEDGPVLVESTLPTLVVQFAHSQRDGAPETQTGDPFMMFIPGVEQFLTEYTIATGGEHFDQHYVNLVTSTDGIAGITQNATAIPSSAFSEIGGTGSGVWAATVSIPDGTHRFEGTEPFGLFVYGWTDAESYGYPGGTAFRYVGLTGATIAEISADDVVVGDEICLSVTLSGTEDAILSGVPVLWTVTGANTAAASIVTDDDGASTFCYTPSEVGSDTVTVTAGTVSATVTLTVEAAPVVEETTSEETVVEDSDGVDGEETVNDENTVEDSDGVDGEESDNDENTVEETVNDANTVEDSDGVDGEEQSDDGERTGSGEAEAEEEDTAVSESRPVPTGVPAGQGPYGGDALLALLALLIAVGGLLSGARVVRSTVRG